jgi:hypothetical protein
LTFAISVEIGFPPFFFLNHWIKAEHILSPVATALLFYSCSRLPALQRPRFPKGEIEWKWWWYVALPASLSLPTLLLIINLLMILLWTLLLWHVRSIPVRSLFAQRNQD